MKSSLRTGLLTLIVCAAFAPRAGAVLLLSEDFTGTGNTTGLEYTDPGSLTTIGGTDANGARREQNSTRFYNLTSSVSSGTVFFSVLYRQPRPVNWGGFSFYDGGTEQLFFGDAGIPFVGPFSIDRNGGSPPGADQSSVPIVGAQTYFMVGAYDFNAGQASLWVDPAFGNAIPVADLSVGHASGWTLTRVRTGSEPDTQFDRIRVGTTWADVVPRSPAVPEPASLLLLGLGLAGLGLARRAT